MRGQVESLRQATAITRARPSQGDLKPHQVGFLQSSTLICSTLCCMQLTYRRGAGRRQETALDTLTSHGTGSVEGSQKNWSLFSICYGNLLHQILRHESFLYLTHSQGFHDFTHLGSELKCPRESGSASLGYCPAYR